MAPYWGSPRKQNKPNSSTHRSCCAQRKMIHLLCQGAHHVCWLHWHGMIHCWCNHSTLKTHTMSIWKHISKDGNLKKNKHSKRVSIQCVQLCIIFISIYVILGSFKYITLAISFPLMWFICDVSKLPIIYNSNIQCRLYSKILYIFPLTVLNTTPLMDKKWILWEFSSFYWYWIRILVYAT